MSRWPAHAAGAAAAARHTSPVRVVPLSRWPFAAAGDSAAPPPLAAAAAAARLTIDAVVVERAGARSSLTAKFHYTDADFFAAKLRWVRAGPFRRKKVRVVPVSVSV